MVCSVLDAYAVSQFTLYARTAKGTRPDFHQAMGGTTAKPLYESFLEKMRSSYAPDKIQGVFIVLTYNRWRFWSHDGRWPNQRRCVLVALLIQVLLL